MKVKEESEIAGLQLNIQKMKIMASGPIISWQIDSWTVNHLNKPIHRLNTFFCEIDDNHNEQQKDKH